MAILISAQKLSHSFGARPLFTGISFGIESGQRIGLIGPNGAGKSTLLKILSGKIKAEDGTLSVQRGLRVGYLEQNPTFSEDASIQSCIMEGSHDPYDWNEMGRAEMLMSKLELNEQGRTPETSVLELSGGWKKRVALARELMREPDLLLLDEPTNHLDVESIEWLEDLLAESRFASVVITHDRLFLQRVSNQIMELDRRHKDGILKVPGDYSTYLELREQLMNAQEQRETKLKNTLRRETEWLRRGAQARQTKQRARIEGHAELSKEVDELSERNANAKIRMDFQGNEKNPKKLVSAEKIKKSYNGREIIPTLDLLITPQTRLGLLGKNGCGKSTLIRLLTGQESPDQGTITQAENLHISYFEQNRESLDPNTTVYQTICPLGDYVDYGDTKIHAKSYLTRFLFSYDQMDMPVGKLSGGEQSRLLLARLMLKRANLLILDEPTNDLDMATLDVLADILKEFGGAVVLVTHDRFFLDQTCNQIMAFAHDQNDQPILERFADLSQWERWHNEMKAKPKSIVKPQPPTPAPLNVSPEKKRKRSYKEQFEFDNMEGNIQKLEVKLQELTARSLTPEISRNGTQLSELTREMGDLQSEIERLYARWAELE